MTTNQKASLEDLLNRYNHISDIEYCKMIRYEKEGNVGKAKYAKFYNDLVDAYLYGVVETLRLLGYDIKWEYGDGNHLIRINEDEYRKYINWSESK